MNLVTLKLRRPGICMYKSGNMIHGNLCKAHIYIYICCTSMYLNFLMRLLILLWDRGSTRNIHSSVETRNIA